MKIVFRITHKTYDAVCPITSNKLKKLIDGGDINLQVVDKFYDAVRKFYQSAYNYDVKCLKLDCFFKKNCQFADFNKRNEMSYSNIE